jgi:hypothetical protein
MGRDASKADQAKSRKGEVVRLRQAKKIIGKFALKSRNNQTPFRLRRISTREKAMQICERTETYKRFMRKLDAIGFWQGLHVARKEIEWD